MATINLPNNSLSTLQSAISAAAVNDVLVVPVGSGSVSWSGWTLNKGVYVRGPGKAALTVSGNFSVQPTTGGAGNTHEISDINFSGSMTAAGPSGTAYTTGIKVHDCNITGVISSGSNPGGWGVVYNCTIQNANKLFDDSGHGNESLGWNLPFTTGGAYFLYFEDCIFSGSGAFVVETGQGGRALIRYSTCNAGDEVWDAHGPNDYAGGRGQVSSEYYGNTASGGRAFNCRGGTNICVHNNLSGADGINKCGTSWDPRGASAWSTDKIKNSYFSNNSGKTVSYVGGYDWGNAAVLGTDYWQCAYGLEAARPASPSVGDTYCSSNALSDHTQPIKIWRCQSAGVWTLVYTSYAYPHPLRGGSSPPVGTPVLSVR